MCLVSGALYGANFAPVIYIKDNYSKYYGKCTQDPCVQRVSNKGMGVLQLGSNHNSIQTIKRPMVPTYTIIILIRYCIIVSK